MKITPLTRCPKCRARARRYYRAAKARSRARKKATLTQGDGVWSKFDASAWTEPVEVSRPASRARKAKP